MSNLADPAIYGEYATALALSMILNLSFFQWNRSALTRNAAHEPSDVSQIVGSAIAIHFINTASVSVVILIASYFLGINLAYPLTMTLICATSDFSLEISRATGREKEYALHYTLRQSMFLLISYVLFSFDTLQSTYNTIVISYLLSFLIALVPFFMRQVMKYRINLSKNYFYLHTKFGLPLVVNFTVTGLINQSDKLVVASILGRDVVGVYALVVDLTKQVLLTLMEAVNLASFPKLVKAYESKSEISLIKTMRENFSILIGTSVPATVGYILVLPTVSKLAIGEEFTQAFLLLPAIIAFASLLRGLRVYYFDQAFHLTRETFKPAVNSICTLAIMSILGVVGAIYWNVQGVALAVLLSSMLSCVLSISVGRRTLRMPSGFRTVFSCGLCTAVMALSVKVAGLWLDPSLASVALQIVAGITTYAICCLILNFANSRSILMQRLRS